MHSKPRQSDEIVCCYSIVLGLSELSVSIWSMLHITRFKTECDSTVLFLDVHTSKAGMSFYYLYFFVVGYNCPIFLSRVDIALYTVCACVCMCIVYNTFKSRRSGSFLIIEKPHSCKNRNFMFHTGSLLIWTGPRAGVPTRIVDNIWLSGSKGSRCLLGGGRGGRGR